VNTSRPFSVALKQALGTGGVAVSAAIMSALFLLIALTLLTGCGGENGASLTGSTLPDRGPASSAPAFTSGTVTFFTAGGEHRLDVEMADTYEKRARGLMGRERLPDDSGMIFTWPAPVRESFWMKDTLIPLSVAFVSNDRVIVDIQDMEPETLTPHQPKQPYIWAIEVNQGYFQRNGISAGDRVEFSEEG
jgi:uncharacterized membrane protein (UPF0127 family)